MVFQGELMKLEEIENFGFFHFTKINPVMSHADQFRWGGQRSGRGAAGRSGSRYFSDFSLPATKQGFDFARGEIAVDLVAAIREADGDDQAKRTEKETPSEARSGLIFPFSDHDADEDANHPENSGTKKDGFIIFHLNR